MATNSASKETQHRIGKGISTSGEMTQEALIKQAFYYLNSFKRHRALAQIKQHEGDRDAKNYNDLKCYQFIDSLELALRAIQSGNKIDQVDEESE